MFEDQANIVIEAVKASKENEAMKGRWSDDVSGYPRLMLGILHLTLRRHALEFIDANFPEAWFRPMFETEVTK
jgi:hypothetical protein